MTEHLTRCAPATPCLAENTIVIQPERLASGLMLAVIACAVVRVLSRIARATGRPVLPCQATPRAVSGGGLAVLAVPASFAVRAGVSYTWSSAPRTTGWAQLSLGLLIGSSLAVVLLGFAVVALLTALQATAQPDRA